MIVRAPGKLFVTGAYAVLEGAPAVIFAIDRWAEARPMARGLRDSNRAVRPEVAAVARRLGVSSPIVDTRMLETADSDRDDQPPRKLGLGSSAAAAVAAAGAIVAASGQELDRTATVDAIFSAAMLAHADVQPLGSGGDVAASTYGGAIVYRRSGGMRFVPTKPGAQGLEIDRLFTPTTLHWSALATQRSIRTSDLLERLAARRDASPTENAFGLIQEAAEAGALSFAAQDTPRFLEAAARHVAGLTQLSLALELPLVPEEVQRARHALGLSQDGDQGVLLPSGAGGGDIVLWLATRPLSEDEGSVLARLGLTPLPLTLSHRGVHRVVDETAAVRTSAYPR